MTKGTRSTPIHIEGGPFRQWNLQIECRNEKPVAAEAGNVTLLPNVTLSGPASAPALSGTIQFTGVKVTANGRTYPTETATVVFDPHLPAAPVLIAKSRANGQPVAIFGPLREPLVAGVPDIRPVRFTLANRPPPADLPMNGVPFTLTTATPRAADEPALDISTGSLHESQRQ
jgi:hypothetical protein